MSSPALATADLTMPPDLSAKGWILKRDNSRLSGETFRAKNLKLKQFSSAYPTPAEAIDAARELDAGKVQVNNGDGSISFQDPKIEATLIRCPQCGNPDELDPIFPPDAKPTDTTDRFNCRSCKSEFTLEPKAKAKPAKATSPSPALTPATGNFQQLPRKAIDPSATNTRRIFDEDKLTELADSIREKGILEPLLVRPKGGSPRSGPLRFELVAGERRLRAAAIAKLELVPCIVRLLSDRQAEEIQTIENDQREDLNPVERGAGYISLIERHGHTPETLAAAVHKSKTFVYDQIKLAKLPKVASDALLEGRIPQSTATLIARIPNERLRANAATEIIRPGNSYLEPMSFREAKRLIERKFSLQLKGAPFSREDATLVPAAGACTTCPKLTGNNRAEFPEGRADVCTDPPCFNSKIAAHDARTRARAKENEVKVLPASTCKSLFNYYGGDIRYGSGYIDLAEQCRQDPQKKKRSYKQLLGDEAEPLLAIHPKSHRAHYVMPERDVAKLLEKNHKIKIQVASSSTSRSSSPKPNPEKERQRKLDREIFDLAVQLAGEAIARQAEIALYSPAYEQTAAGMAKHHLLAVACLMFENSLQYGGDGEAEERIALRLGLIEPPKTKSPPHQSRNRSAYAALQKFLKTGAKGSTPEQIFGLAVQLEFAGQVYGNKLDEREERVLKMFPRVGPFKNYLESARAELTKPAEAQKSTAKPKAKAAGNSKG